jgi:hypothetical protein
MINYYLFLCLFFRYDYLLPFTVSFLQVWLLITSFVCLFFRYDYLLPLSCVFMITYYLFLCLFFRYDYLLPLSYVFSFTVFCLRFSCTCAACVTGLKDVELDDRRPIYACVHEAVDVSELPSVLTWNSSPNIAKHNSTNLLMSLFNTNILL